MADEKKIDETGKSSAQNAIETADKAVDKTAGTDGAMETAASKADENAGDEVQIGAGEANVEDSDAEAKHVTTTQTKNGDTTEFVLTLPVAIGDDELDADVLEELTRALGQFLDETGDNGRMAIDYIIGVTEGKQKIAKAKTVEDFETALVENIVLPVARSAAGMPNPNDAISVLMSIDDKAFVEEIAAARESGIVNEEVDLDAIDFARMTRKFISLCAQGIGDDGADAALNDVVRYQTQKDQGKLPDIPKNKFGFFKKLKMTREVLKKQAKMLRTMLKQAHSRRDIEIWYSRYALAAPIEAVKEDGFPHSLARAATMPPEAIKKDCAQIAQAMGFECESWDIDYGRILQGMRTFCVNKTGYSYPENWLYAVMSKWDMDSKKLG